MIYVLTYSPSEDDAAIHGETREPFDGIGVLGHYENAELADRAIDEDKEKRPNLGIKYLIDGR